MEAVSEDLRSKLEDYLRERLQSPISITAMSSLSGGACQDNYLVDVEVEHGADAGKYELVMRTDKGGSLLTSLSRIDEFAVCQMTNKAGVNTPQPYWLEKEAAVIGHPFYFMKRIPGKATGRYVIKDKSLNSYRKNLAGDLAANLALIHKITPENCSDQNLRTRLESPGAEKPALFNVKVLREMLSQLPEAYPVLELGLNWMESAAPETDEMVLIHGDFRTGNFMISPDGLEGIVDWEFAHWGDRHEDISWLCMRDWRFGKIKKHVGGFAERAEFYEAYEKASGTAVDPQKILFWEVKGNISWALGAAQQAQRHLTGADKGIEFASIGRRVCEMEYETLRLIENAG